MDGKVIQEEGKIKREKQPFLKVLMPIVFSAL